MGTFFHFHQMLNLLQVLFCILCIYRLSHCKKICQIYILLVEDLWPDVGHDYWLWLSIMMSSDIDFVMNTAITAWSVEKCSCYSNQSHKRHNGIASQGRFRDQSLRNGVRQDSQKPVKFFVRDRCGFGSGGVVAWICCLMEGGKCRSTLCADLFL